MPQPSVLRTSAAIMAVAGLVLTGCTPDETEEVLVPPTEDDVVLEDDGPLAEDGTATQADGATDDLPPLASSIEVPSLDASCVLDAPAPEVDRVTYNVPSSWQVAGSCGVLDPEMEELPADGTESGAGVVVSVDPVPFEDVTSPDSAVTDLTSWLGARSGFLAARSTATSTGEGQVPERSPVLTWAFDLTPEPEQEGTLSIFTNADDERVRAVADAIAQTVVIQPPADRQADNSAPESLAVVRVETGDTPYAVTFDGDCFTLREGGAESGRTDLECDLDPEAGTIVTGILGEDVLVGYAPATSIAVQSDDLAPPYALTANVEDDSVFAFRVDEIPAELTAIGPAGAELVTAPVG